RIQSSYIRYVSTVTKKRGYDMTGRAAAAAHTRIRILEAAYRLLMEQAFDDVTIPKIAESAGVSAPTVVLHFRTKDGLIEALAEWGQEREEVLREVPGGDPVEAARKICARYEEHGAAVVRLLAIEGRVAALDRAFEVGRAGHRTWVIRTFGARLGTGAAR